MAHFAEIENGIVKRVLAASEAEALHFPERYGGEWVQTYTKSEARELGGETRKNYAGKGYSFDAERDAFIPPKPYPSWGLDEATCNWNPPVPLPDDAGRKHYSWNEEQGEWSVSSF